MKTDASNIFSRIVSACVAVVFCFSAVITPGTAVAQSLPLTMADLPVPGTMVATTSQYRPLMIKGIRVHPENPLKFNFIMDTGDSEITGAALRSEANRLVKYFLASLTMPENEMWVNLSPYEKNRIITESFGRTEMGRDLLAQDYILKQLTASLMYPEKQLGSVFWKRVRQKLQQKYGTTDIPVNTFNKVWIVPDQAVVYEHDRSAFVVQSHLKVMLQQDYLALDHHINEPEKELAIALDVEGESLEKSSEVASEMVREVLIPEIEREVNEGENFTALRQIYQSMILASWFKDNLKETLLGKVYMNQVKTRGIETDDEEINQQIYQRYLEAFEAGVYSYIKEEIDPDTQEMIPRKYFSGGITTMNVGTVRRDLATLPRTEQERILTAASQLSPRAQILDIEVDFLGLGAEAGDLVINTVKKANERGVPIIMPVTDQGNAVRSDKAVLSEAQKIAVIKGYRIDTQEFLTADAENADDIAGAIKDINAEAAKGKFTEVQTLLNYLKFGPFTEEAKALALREGDKVDRLLSGERGAEDTAEAAAVEEGKPARKTKVLYRLTLDWKKNISSEERILLDQIDSAIRDDDLFLVGTLLNRLRNVGTLSTPRREQVIQEMAKVNLYRFNKDLAERGRPKPVVFAEKNYPKFLKAVTAAEDALGLSQYVAKEDYSGAVTAIMDADFRKIGGSSLGQIGGLGAYLLEQDFRARLFDLRRDFLRQLQEEFRAKGKQLTLTDIIANGRVLGLEADAEVIPILSEYLSINTPTRPSNVTLDRLASGYTFPILREQDISEEERRQRNRIMIEDTLNRKIKPLIGDYVKLDIMDQQTADSRERQWLEMVDREDVVRFILEVDDNVSQTVNTESVDVLFDKLIALTHSDVPRLLTRFVELGIINRPNPEQPNTGSERNQLNNFFYDTRGQLSSRERAEGRVHHPLVQTREVSVKDAAGQEYAVRVIRSKRWASMTRIQGNVDLIERGLQKVMQHPNRDEKFRQNFPGVLRLRQGSGRLYMRVFEEEKTVVILAYHTAGFFKKPGSQSDLSQETKDHLNPVSGSSLQTLDQLQALYALLPVTVDENLAVTKDTPPEATDKSRRDKATLSRADGEVGGIDLNPALLDLQIRRDDSGIPLPLPQQPVDNIHIQGIVPIIIQITPVNSLPLLMGFVDTPQPVDSAQSSPLAPADGPSAYDGQDLPQVSLLY